MSQAWVITMFVAVVLVLMLAFTLLDIWTAAPEGPDYGLNLVAEDRGHLDDAPVEGCDCEDCTEDPMDAYLEQRAAGNGVLPTVVEVKATSKIHYACYDAYHDREPSRMCEDCATNLLGAPR